jgi:uncharacterized protein
MKHKFFATTAAMVVAAFMYTSAFAGALEDGKAAYDKGDYKAARKIWQPLADKGDAGAQYGIGILYQKGTGVMQNYGAAMKWHRLAADQGHAAAQISVGTMYSQGKSVEQDLVQAYMWLSLAADKSGASAEDKQSATMARDKIAAQMTAEQVAEAGRLAAVWKPTK